MRNFEVANFEIWCIAAAVWPVVTARELHSLTKMTKKKTMARVRVRAQPRRPGFLQCLRMKRERSGSFKERALHFRLHL